MKPILRSMVAVLVLTAITALAPAQEKVLLQRKAAAGQTTRSSSTLDVELSAAGQQIKLETKSTDVTKYTVVGANGDITYETKAESREMTMGGQKMPEAPDNDVSTITVRPNNTLVSYKTSGEESEATKVGVRIANSTSPVFSANPVGPGDIWTHTYAADAAIGTVAAEATFEVLAFEDYKGIPTAKIKMDFKESGSGGISAVNTLWVERSSGDTVVAEVNIQNIPFGEGEMRAVANAKGRTERTSGSPLAGGPQAEAPKEKTIDDTVKDFEKVEGLVTLYRRRTGGRTTIYMEVKEELLGKNFLLQTTASTGDAARLVAGDPVSDILFQMRIEEGDRLVWVAPRVGFRADPSVPHSRSVQRSFAESYLESFRIEARQPDRKSLLIDISDLFRGDISGIAQRFSGGGGLPIPGLGGGGGSYSLDREKTFVRTLKAFPTNVYVESTYNFTRGGAPGGIESMVSGVVTPDPRSVVVNVNYNLWVLSETGYTPRRADSRVGYFTADYLDFTRPVTHDLTVKNILRWNLVKKDPSAPLSEPVEPIVFWLDNAIPTQYRAAFRDGLLVWNKAFEKVGFKNAVVVRQMPDDADFDHADMRYNVIRWVSSPSQAYAVALFRNNPITGQIVNASITVDAGIVRFFGLEHSQIIDPASVFTKDDPEKLALERARMLHDHECGVACRLGNDVQFQAAAGFLMLRLLNPAIAGITEDAYVNQFVRWVVAHEFGHILGLRHNFIASTELDLKALADPAIVNSRGTSASVMDYVAFNPSALKKPNVAFFGPGIGQYDYHAIEYGYRPLGKTTPEAEVPELKKIASKYNSPGLAYQTDEVADAFDPLITRFDLSAKPMEYSRRMMEITSFLLRDLDKRLPGKGESFWEFTRDFQTLVGVYAGSAMQASRYIGALHMNGNHRGDPGQRPTLAPASASDQRAALAILNQFVFSETSLQFPKRYYQMLTSDPNANMVEAFLAGPNDYPIRDRISGIQTGALRRIFRADVLRRVSNNEFKAERPQQALTMNELFTSVAGNVWSEVRSGKPVNELRRSLQRAHLDVLGEMVLRAGAPEDARMLAWSQLRAIKAGIVGMKTKPTDPYSQTHYAEAIMRIDRVLKAQQTIGAAPAAQPNLLQMLLGGSGSRP